MTVISPAFVIQASSHPAQTFREMLQAVMGSPTGSFTPTAGGTNGLGGQGIMGANDLAVSQNGTPNMSVNVAQGFCFVRGSESAHQGVYQVYNDATLNVPISAADPTNGRKDLIVVQIRDAAYSGASNDARIVAVTGTPSGAPADPAVPANSFVLARVNVAAAASSITNANIDNLRTRAFALGGICTCTSITRPTSPFEGLWIYETDTDRAYVYNGTQWQPVSGGYKADGSAWTAGTSYSAITGASITLPAGAWLIQGKGYFAASTGSVRTISLRIYNTSTSTSLDDSTQSAPVTTSDVSLSCLAAVNLTGSNVVRLEAKVSTVDGTQLMGNSRITAIPQSVWS